MEVGVVEKGPPPLNGTVPNGAPAANGDANGGGGDPNKPPPAEAPKKEKGKENKQPEKKKAGADIFYRCHILQLKKKEGQRYSTLPPLRKVEIYIRGEKKKGKGRA